MSTNEEIARAICEAEQCDPDGLVQPWPAGAPIPYWQHFAPLADAVGLWLLRFSR
jgi:hypothetical protein